MFSAKGVMVEKNDFKRRAELFFEKKISVHIDTANGKFYNGLIMEIGSDFLFIHERILGNTFVLFSQIETLEPYVKKTEEENEENKTSNRKIKELFDNMWETGGKNSPCQMCNVKQCYKNEYQFLSEEELKKILSDKGDQKTL